MSQSPAHSDGDGEVRAEVQAGRVPDEGPTAESKQRSKVQLIAATVSLSTARQGCEQVTRTAPQEVLASGNCEGKEGM